MNPAAVRAWTADGHTLLTERSIRVLEPLLSGLTAEERTLLVRSSVQPDLMRPRSLADLRDIEAARHYFNLERLGERDLPYTLAGFVRQLDDLAAEEGSFVPVEWRFRDIGTLPYAIVECTERLAALFAQLRLRPKDREVRLMAVMQAGELAHYAQDLTQPLHTTIHHDGRANAKGISAGTGIHLLMDRLPGRFPEWVQEVEPVAAGTLDPLFGGVDAAMRSSHAMVAEVYRLETDLWAVEETGQASLAVRQLVAGRIEQSVQLTADLIQTAWSLSASIEVPHWARGEGGAKELPTTQPEKR